MLESPPAELDLAAIAAAYEERARRACDGNLAEALELRGRLAPERWTLEWHLPWWAGRAFGLDAATCRELVLGNVLGLAALRLRDDATDGELDTLDAPTAARFADRLMAAALEPYRRRFDDASPLWPELDRLLAAWGAADGGQLARRGAPLKASAHAVCLLAGRPDAYWPLARCVDHALTALVLYDHAADWEADLAAGRWNALVAEVAPDVDGRPGTRADVLVALMVGRPVRSYFARIAAELDRASALAEQLGIGDLADHLGRVSTRMGNDGLALEAHYGSLGDRAGALLLGDRTTADVAVAGQGGG